MTREADVDAAIALGVDAVGFILVAKSPRRVDVARAAALRRRLPPFVQSVVLVRNASADEVRNALVEIQPDLLQFHGEESPEFCTQFQHPFLKAIAMQDEPRTLAELAEAYRGVSALLLDGHAAGGLGGQGRAFDWRRATARPTAPIVLAGGLHPENVAAAVTLVEPYAVDVSSGIEAAPGVKDSGKMLAFVREVQRADAERESKTNA